jgi:UDP-N-acetylmuramate: L-alanyl-gamma-D-glutamyl-meso-diaminopimelate ligase
LIYNKDGLKIFRDFAHAPSKLKATVKAVKKQFEDSQLIAVFELHTFSSMNLNFLPQYSSALDEADVAIVYFSNHAFELKRIKPFTAEEIKNGFSKNNLMVINDKESLISAVRDNFKGNSILLLMSSGSFDNIKIEDFFSE